MNIVILKRKSSLKKLKTKGLNLKKSYYESKMKDKFDYKLSLKLDETINKLEAL